MSNQPGKLRPGPSAKPDRNANEENQLGAKPKAQINGQRILLAQTDNHQPKMVSHPNYMELEFLPAEPAALGPPITFTDLPVSYATSLVGPPPYRDPPPPTPPPLSQIPSRLLHSAPNSPSRGKVVLGKKERKELSKQLGIDEASILSSSAQSSPYKGRVSELKNCIARGLFATLHRGSQKSLHHQDERVVSQEISPPRRLQNLVTITRMRRTTRRS